MVREARGRVEEMRRIEDLLREELEACERDRWVKESMDRVWMNTMHAMRWPVTIIGTLGIVVILLIVGFTLLGCHDGCDKNATRCNGDSAEMCSSGGDWTLIADCSEIEGAAFECCADPAGGYNCMLTTECLPPDAGVDGGAP